MAKEKESLEMYLSQEQIEHIKSLPEEERQKAAEDMLGIKRYKNGAVDLTTVPGKTGDFFRKKQQILNPEQVRGKDGLTVKRYSPDHYFECTCPFCGTTAEHEGKKYRYSKKTRMLIARDAAIIALIAVLASMRILHVVIALIAVTFATMDLARHSERKMYYTAKCRKCNSHFPMEGEELEQLKRDLAAQAEQAQEE